MNRKLIVALLLSVLLLSLGSFGSTSVVRSEGVAPGSGEGLSANATDTITLEAKDIAFEPRELTIDASNEPVTIRMENTGAALHNFTIDALDIDVDVNPGETVDFVIPAGTAPGTYDFYCNVPGHREAGMIGTLTVVGVSSPEQLTAAAEAQSAAETATAEANASAEAATATAEATAAALATQTANAEATQEAILESWDTYFQSIGATLSESATSLPGVAIDTDSQSCPEDQIPSNFEYCESYEAYISGGDGDTWTALAIYASEDEAKAAFDQMKGGLPRSGWQEAKVDGLAHDHVCLTLVHDETSQAVCYTTRDDALIVSYSYLDVDAPDAALQNAVDLAKLMNDAYDQTDRPA